MRNCITYAIIQSIQKKVTSQNSSLFLVYISTTEEKIETINSVSLKMLFPLVVQYELTGDITVDE